MIRKIIKIVFVLVVLLVIAGIAAFFYVDSLAKAAIERGGTYAMGVDTTVESADIEVLAGTFSMRDFTVANPAGFESERFFSLGSGDVAVSLGTLTEDVIELPRLNLGDIVMNLEKGEDGKANYEPIVENLKRFESKEPAESPRFVIREIRITNVKVIVDMNPLGVSTPPITVPVDEIVMTDVGEGGVGKSGLTLGELCALVVKTVLAAAIENGGGLIPTDMLLDLKDEMKGLAGLGDIGLTIGGDAMKQLDSLFQGDLGDVQEDLKNAGDEIGDKIRDLGEGLGGILGGGQREGNDAKDDADDNAPETP